VNLAYRGNACGALFHTAGLNGNPLVDIASTRKIGRVYLRGQEYPGAAMPAR
jgi:hypothetical protein